MSNSSRTESAHAVGFDRARSNHALAAMRSLVLGVITVIFLALCVLQRTIARNRLARREVVQVWTQRWLRVCSRVAGIRVKHEGVIPQEGSFITPNHLGYTDVLALGSIVKCFFVAKRDVERWPFIGTLFRATEQIGVPRSRSHGLLDAYQRINERLKDKQSVCVFLEGTSTGGGEVREFHGSLLQVAINAAAPVVPTAIRWDVDGEDIDVSEDVAYWKDHVFVPHLWRLLGLRGITVRITFGKPISSAAYDRKALAETARKEVVKLLELPAGA